jgi:hypothetical protein
MPASRTSTRQCNGFCESLVGVARPGRGPGGRRGSAAGFGGDAQTECPGRE